MSRKNKRYHIDIELKGHRGTERLVKTGWLYVDAKGDSLEELFADAAAILRDTGMYLYLHELNSEESALCKRIIIKEFSKLGNLTAATSK